MFEEVILVNSADEQIGTMEKLEAHKDGYLHRAFSILIFNPKGEMLLQQRALTKYHSPGKWTNTCCSHPRPNETVLQAADRRLIEEMGMTVALTEIFHFTYRAELEFGLIEHEIDHVLIGISNETPHLNLEEAMAFQWKSIESIQQEMKQDDSIFTPWFLILMNAHADQIKQHFSNES